MSIALQIIIAALAIPIIDWALIWQVENAFAAFLRKSLMVPKWDSVRFAILFAIFLTVTALLLRVQIDVAGIIGIILVVIYFWRIIRTARPSHATEES